MKVGEFKETLKQDVPYSNELQWWVRWYPAGAGGPGTAKNNVSLFVMVSKPVTVKYAFGVVNSYIKNDFADKFTDLSCSHGFPKFATHAQLRPLFRNGTLTITCYVSFDNFTSLKPSLNLSCDHFPTDFELVIKSKKIPVHRDFLSMCSPVFHAMITHDTIEAKSGKVKITDFDFKTTKAAIGICYGQKLENPSVENVISILRFADKYDIKVIVDRLEKPLLKKICLEDFCSIVSYAWECSRNDAQKACAVFLNANRVKVTKLKNFATLPSGTVCGVLKLACNS